MPLFTGIFASAISGNLTPADAGSYFPLGEFTAGTAGLASIDFTNIPQTYSHLQLRLLVRDDRASSAVDFMRLRFNNDSTNGNYYTEHILSGNGSSATAGASGASTAILINPASASTAPANTFGAIILDILDYKSVNKNKTTRYLGGLDRNGSGEIILGSGLWFPSSISAINRITITGAFGNFVAGTHAALYGVL